MRTRSLGLIARIGYVARGVVYILIGALSLLAAFGSGGKTTGSKGALTTLVDEPWGVAILSLIALGLFGFTLWRGMEAFLDADGHGKDAKGMVIRGGLAASAVAHAFLGIYAVSLAFGLGVGSTGSGGGSEGIAAWLLRQPFGQYLLGIVAVAIFAVGIAQFWKAFSGKYRDRLSMSEDLMNTLSPVCVFGIAARAAVFLIVGGFFLYAAYTLDPDQAGGLAAALSWLRSQSYGNVMLGVIAAGLFAFGIYGIIQGIWRRVDTSEAEKAIDGVQPANL